MINILLDVETFIAQNLPKYILFKKRNAKPHIGDIGKIILIAVWQVLVTYSQ